MNVPGGPPAASAGGWTRWTVDGLILQGGSYAPRNGLSQSVAHSISFQSAEAAKIHKLAPLVNRTHAL